MSSSSSWSNNRASFNLRDLCDCTKKLKTLTSWTKDNPGRRFEAFPNSMIPKLDCGYFQWVDPKLTPWYRRLLYNVHEKVLAHEEMIEKQKLLVEEMEKELKRYKSKMQKYKDKNKDLNKQLTVHKSRDGKGCCLVLGLVFVLLVMLFYK
ncbi:unnamed protein product [Lactuca virosa]|uniref:GRF-type domain-containing protein n=1 Tax=Lactuca virosa TaxID=75947 RepID=A0AAU9M4U2_9ASTR|nr:unnamed protein product [Lactuca virosa]